jgi:uncharacterized YccA/Bax inhibitor family protein
MIRSANPALSEKTFTQFEPVETKMTLNGTVNKTGLMMVLLVGGGTWTWHLFYTQANFHPWMIGGLIGGLITALITIFKKEAAPVTAPLYAAFEGLLLGGLSALFETHFPGIVIQAVMLTFGILAALLLAYRSGLIKPTENFKLGVTAATGGICLVYIVTIILGLFGIGIPMIHGSGLVGIGFSLFVVVIASLNLVMDFDFIESGVEHGAPKFMEWYAAFGLMVTLVWLYLEILRLLAKLRSRD